MVQKATATATREPELDKGVAPEERGGVIEQAGRRADELLELLRDEDYQAEIKKIVPGAEVVLNLEVIIGLQPRLFD